MRRTPILRVVTGLVAVTGLAACSGGSSSGSSSPSYVTAAAEGNAIHGGVLTPPNAEPRIALTDAEGASYDIEQRNAGKVTLVFFGYTHCPDTCPTTMADIAQALRQSSPTVRSEVTVDFVTVDPHRDSRRVLRKWLDGFSSSFVGLRGSLPQVVAAQRLAGLPVSRVEKNGKTIEHSPEVIAYTPDHMAHVIYFDGPSTIEDLVHDLPILTTGQGYGA